MQHGLFFVLEGADGSGKGTQFNLLAERLRAVGYDVALFDFPQYDNPSSHFVKTYLNGGYGPASSVSPYTASMFYALDRYEASASIKKALAEGKIVLANRFVGSNMAHQGSKFTNLAERRGFFLWEDSLEFQLLGIPRPTLNLFLHVPAEISYKLISKKAARSYTKKSHDEHEGDINHLRNSVETYEQLCKLFPKDFVMIECTQNDKILSIPTINNRIWDVLKPFLPKEPQHRPHEKVVKLGDQPKQELAKSPPIIVGPPVSHDQIELPLRNISLLVERAFAASFSVNKNIRSATAANKYYVPTGLPVKLARMYNQILHDNLNAYRTIAKETSPAAAEPILPLAYLTSLGLSSDITGWKNSLTNLSYSPIDEVRELAKRLSVRLKNTRSKTFKDLEIPSKRFNVLQVAKVIDEISSTISDSGAEAVSLTAWTPRNELDLLDDITYSNSDLSKTEIRKRLGNLPFQQKNETLLAFLLAPTANQAGVLDEVRYCFDFLTDGVVLTNLLNTDLFDQVQLQSATPRYGYDIPAEIEGTELEEMYIKCFDDSLVLYSELQARGFIGQSQYAVLMGHRVRWQARLSAKNSLQLKAITATQSANYQGVVEQIFEKISEVHPTLSTRIIDQHKSTKS